MPDQIAYPALGLLAAGLIALALVWPQGEGARSPAPFGYALAPLEPPVIKPPGPGARIPGRLRRLHRHPGAGKAP